MADRYTNLLRNIVKTPVVPDGYLSSWAQYSILLEDKKQRDELQKFLSENGIPSMIYYRKPMHCQGAFNDTHCVYTDLSVTEKVCDRVLSLPMHPYLTEEDQDYIVDSIKKFLNVEG